MLLQLSHFCPFTPTFPLPPSHTPPPYSSCPWVILISSLASTFPILFLPSPCRFSTYTLCYLFSVPFPPTPPPNPPAFPPTYFMSMGCTCKFFEFSVSYTIFDLSLSILCLPIMLPLPCAFSPLFLPSPSPLTSLHVMSISLILFLF